MTKDELIKALAQFPDYLDIAVICSNGANDILDPTSIPHIEFDFKCVCEDKRFPGYIIIRPYMKGEDSSAGFLHQWINKNNKS